MIISVRVGGAVLRWDGIMNFAMIVYLSARILFILNIVYFQIKNRILSANDRQILANDRVNWSSLSYSLNDRILIQSIVLF